MKLGKALLAISLTAITATAQAAATIDTSVYFAYAQTSRAGDALALSKRACENKRLKAGWRLAEFIDRYGSKTPACWRPTKPEGDIEFCVEYTPTVSDCRSAPKSMFLETKSLPRGAQF